MSTPTDTGGNTYVIDEPTGGGSGFHGGAKTKTWIATNITGFTGTVSCKSATNSNIIETTLLNWSGIQSSPIDGTVATINNGSVSASPWTTGTLTTANARDVIITWISTENSTQTWTVPTGFTFSDSTVNDAFAYKIVNATQSTAYSWAGNGSSDHMAAGAIGLKILAGSVPPRPALIIQ